MRCLLPFAAACWALPAQILAIMFVFSRLYCVLSRNLGACLIAGIRLAWQCVCPATQAGRFVDKRSHFTFSSPTKLLN